MHNRVKEISHHVILQGTDRYAEERGLQSLNADEDSSNPAGCTNMFVLRLFVHIL